MRFKEKSDSIEQLAISLSIAQSQFKDARKSSSVDFFTRGKKVSYKYADLKETRAACIEGLNENGLSISQLVTARKQRAVLLTVLMHKSGEYICSETPLETEFEKQQSKYNNQGGTQNNQGGNISKEYDPKSFGSEITYKRRYALGSILGIVTDDDFDAGYSKGAENGNNGRHESLAQTQSEQRLQFPNWKSDAEDVRKALMKASSCQKVNEIAKNNNFLLNEIYTIDKPLFDELKQLADSMRDRFSENMDTSEG